MGMWLQRRAEEFRSWKSSETIPLIEFEREHNAICCGGAISLMKVGHLNLGTTPTPDISPIKEKCIINVLLGWLSRGSEKSDMILIFNKARQRVCSHWSYLWVSRLSHSKRKFGTFVGLLTGGKLTVAEKQLDTIKWCQANLKTGLLRFYILLTFSQ